MNCRYYHELKFSKNKAVLLRWFENLNCPYYHELKISKKYGRFYKVTWKFRLLLSSRGSNFFEVTWKFELPLLPWAEVFSKIKPFCWSDLKIFTASIIMSWNFLKNKAVFLKWRDNWTAPIITRETISQKWGSFVDVTWKHRLPLLSQRKVFTTERPFLYNHLKISAAPIITSWHFLKNMEDVIKLLESSHCPYLHEVKFS